MVPTAKQWTFNVDLSLDISQSFWLVFEMSVFVVSVSVWATLPRVLH